MECYDRLKKISKDSIINSKPFRQEEVGATRSSFQDYNYIPKIHFDAIFHKKCSCVVIYQDLYHHHQCHDQYDTELPHADPHHNRDHESYKYHRHYQNNYEDSSHHTHVSSITSRTTSTTTSTTTTIIILVVLINIQYHRLC